MPGRPIEPTRLTSARCHFPSRKRPFGSLISSPQGSRPSTSPRPCGSTGRSTIGRSNGASNQLVRRHESLRTSFVAIWWNTSAVVEQDVSLSLDTADLTELPLDVRENEAQRRAIDESRRPFDLTRGPARSRQSAATGQRRPRGALDDAPPHHRRLVIRRCRGRAGDPLRGLLPRPSIASTGHADPVC